MDEASGTARDYCCVFCGAILSWSGEVSLDCPGCERRYPILRGIPILTSRPNALLAASQRALGEARSQLETWRAAPGRLAEAPAGPRPGLAERARRMLEGSDQNLTLLETYGRPIAEHLSGLGPQPPSPLDLAVASSVSWPPLTILPYFYQDWGETAELEGVRTLVGDALVRHSAERGAVAILGAGACGLVQAASRSFDLVYGVDVSAPTLLLAQGVLSGDAIVVHLERAEWRAVRLAAPPSDGNEIRLVVADGSSLPFAHGCMSAVVTQYLMDIVPNPLAVASEIQRVLRGGGIWVNFSKPFYVPGEVVEMGPPGLTELPQLLQPLGLEMIDSHSQRFALLNLEKIYAGGDRSSQEVHYFVARKIQPLAASGIEQRTPARDWRDSDEWWQRVPRVVPGREVQIILRRVFAPDGVEEREEIGLANASFPVAREHVAFVEALFGQIDGKRTAGEIFARLTAGGVPFSEMQFRELLQYLAHHLSLLWLNRFA